MIDVALIGTGGMMPLPRRWLASAAVRCDGRIVVFDCGEGTQIAARATGFGFRGIDAILITHFHADHIAGLPGLLFMIAQADRTDPVVIAGPVGLERILRGLLVIVGGLPFEIQLEELRGGETFEAGGLTASCVAGDHSVRCLAYRLDLPRLARFQPDRAADLGIPKPLWRRLQAGETIEWQGEAIEPSAVLGPPRPGLRVGYVTDSRSTAAMPAFFDRADLLICEGTFADPADTERARLRKHMVFRESAELARASRAKRLWITHFSPSLDDPHRWADQATSRFPGAVIGRDGMQISLPFVDPPDDE